MENGCLEKFDWAWKFTGGLAFAVFWTHAKQVFPNNHHPRTIPNPKKGYSYGPAIVFLDGEIKSCLHRIVHRSQIVKLINR